VYTNLKPVTAPKKVSSAWFDSTVVSKDEFDYISSQRNIGTKGSAMLFENVVKATKKYNWEGTSNEVVDRLDIKLQHARSARSLLKQGTNILFPDSRYWQSHLALKRLFNNELEFNT
jgi:hypothetical protein